MSPDPNDPTRDVPDGSETAVAERLAAVASAVRPPDTAASDDVVRGRRLVRRRRLVAGAAVLATVAVIGTGVAVATGGPDDSTPVAGDPAPSATDPATADPSPTGTPTSPPEDTRDAKELLTDYAAAVADHLDPGREHLQVKVTGVTGTGDGIGTKLGWKVDGDPGLGMVEVFATNHDGPDAYNYFCDRFTPCERRTVDGIRARVQHDGDTVTVWAVHDDGSAGMLHIDPLFGNNSLTPLESLQFPVDQLIRAAADPRLTPPTARQIECVDEAFGWPSMDLNTGKQYKHGKPQCR